MEKSYKDKFEAGELPLGEMLGHLLDDMYDDMRDHQINQDAKDLDKMQDLNDRIKAFNSSLNNNNKVDD